MQNAIRTRDDGLGRALTAFTKNLDILAQTQRRLREVLQLLFILALLALRCVDSRSQMFGCGDLLLPGIVKRLYQRLALTAHKNH